MPLLIFPLITCFLMTPKLVVVVCLLLQPLRKSQQSLNPIQSWSLGVAINEHTMIYFHMGIRLWLKLVMHMPVLFHVTPCWRIGIKHIKVHYYVTDDRPLSNYMHDLLAICLQMSSWECNDLVGKHSVLQNTPNVVGQSLPLYWPTSIIICTLDLGSLPQSLCTPGTLGSALGSQCNNTIRHATYKMDLI